MRVTGLLVLNTPLKVVSGGSSNPEDHRTTHPSQPDSPQPTAEGLKGFTYGSHCSSFYSGNAQQAKESWRGLNLKEAGKQPGHGFLAQPTRLPACLRGLLRDYGDFYLQVTSSNLVQVRDNKGIM